MPATVACRNSLRQKMGPIDPLQSPWRRAELAAAMARTTWGIKPGEPIRNPELSGLLNVPIRLLSEGDDVPNSPIGAGFCAGASYDNLEVMLSKRRQTGRHFELARLVGDDLTAPRSESLLPATQAKTSRQKFQRAFVQELLCPCNALNALFGTRIPDEDEMEEAAIHFHVSPLLVKTTLVNRGRLSRLDLTRD